MMMMRGSDSVNLREKLPNYFDEALSLFARCDEKRRERNVM
jgi:hypothetical protein